MKMAENGSEGVYERLKTARKCLVRGHDPREILRELLDALIDEYGMRAVAVEQPQMYRRCTAALNIKGEQFRCELELPYGENGHEGLAHCNRDAEAIWNDSNAEVH